MRITTDNALLLVVDFQARLMPAIFESEALAIKTAAFAKGCRVLGVPIIAMQQYTKGLGETVGEIREALGDFEHVEKITFSCCGCAEFAEKLAREERKNILLTGIEAHICVQQTALDLLETNYNVYLITDCVGSRFEADRFCAERRMEKAGAVLTTMESVLFEMLGRADHPHRKEISSIVK